MENKIYCLVKKLKADRVRRQRFTAVMIVLSMIVSSTVFWQLHSTGNALTDEFLCGMSEHKHTAECLSQELKCSDESEEHNHTPQCYKAVFSCGEREHIHTVQCRSDISADIETEADWEATLPEKMTDDRCENIVAVAESQLGYTESTKNFIIADDGVSRKGYTRYGKWYGNPYGDWNTLFAYFCLYYAGVTEKELPYGSGCWAWTEALKKAELFNSPKDVTVKVGDLVFFDTDSDEKPDRVGIVSEIKEDEKAGITITAIEGDLDGKVDKAEYSLADEMLAGFVSLDNLSDNAEKIFAEDFYVVNPYTVNLLADGNVNQVHISCSNGVNKLNDTSANNPIIVYPGDTLSLKVSLERKGWNAGLTEGNEAYYTAFSNITNKSAYPDVTDDMIEEWQKYPTSDNSEIYYSFANIWMNDNSGWGESTKKGTPDGGISYNLVDYEKIYTVPNVDEVKDYTFTYNNCCLPNDFTNLENIYVRVEPNNQNQNERHIWIKNNTDKGLDAKNFYEMNEGDTVTITIKTNKFSWDQGSGYDAKKLTNGSTIYTPVRVSCVECDYQGENLKNSDGSTKWGNGGTLQNVTNETYSIDNQGNLVIEQTFKANSISETGYVRFFPQDIYNNDNNIYLQINPTQQTPTKLKMIKPTQEKTNKHLTAETAFSMQPGESVTLVGTVGRDKYTLYDNAEVYNKAKAENKDNELRFVQIGNKYISTYARFWGLDDRNDNQYTSDRFKEDSVKYALDGDNLTVTATYTAKEIGITNDNKYIVTFADEKGYGSIEQFWLENDAPLVYVYSTVGWKDIDRVHEAMDGKGGNSGNGSYWQNGPDANAHFGSGEYYIVHPGDWIFLAGEGNNGYFSNLRLVTNNTDATQNSDNPPNINMTYEMPDTSKTTGIKLTMPSDVNGDYLYAIDYNCTTDSGNKTKTFYFRLSNKVFNGYDDNGNFKWYSFNNYDHADIEIADGGVYEMISEHSVKPDGTEIETVRVYKSCITSIDHCDVKSGNSVLVTINGGDYSAQNNPGETQYELTSKYKTNGNGVRNDPIAVADHHSFNQNDVTGADFYVNVLLIPDTEITTIRYPNGVTEQIINADFKETGSIDVKGVTLEMDRQSVIDAVNKCPNHSGLDFTIRDEAVTKQMRSGNALIEAYKRFKDDQGKEYSDDLVGGEFEFELYQYFPTNGDTYNPATDEIKLVDSSAHNVAQGYVYFDSQFYIDLDLNESDTPKEYYYLIKEKIPYVYLNVGDQNKSGVTYFYKTEKTADGNKVVEYTDVSPNNAPDASIYVKNKNNGYDKYIKAQANSDITYSTHTERVKVTVTPGVDADNKPIYNTKVEYLDMHEDPEFTHTYTPKDANHNPTGEPDRTIPAFVNIKKTYTLPSTGGSGTTIFYICGPILMLTAAAMLVIRRRKEDKQQ